MKNRKEYTTWAEHFGHTLATMLVFTMTLVVTALLTYAIYAAYLTNPIPVLALLAFFVIAAIAATIQWWRTP